MYSLREYLNTYTEDQFRNVIFLLYIILHGYGTNYKQPILQTRIIMVGWLVA